MDVLRKQLSKSLTGGQAFVPLQKAINNVKPELRNVRPNENLHSVWEELEHLRIAQEDIINYMLDANWKSPKWPDDYWPESNENPSGDEWQKSYNNFLDGINKAIEIVNDDGIDLLSIIPHTESHTYLREILILIEHNAYHIGKIVDIRKALGDW